MGAYAQIPYIAPPKFPPRWGMTLIGVCLKAPKKSRCGNLVIFVVATTDIQQTRLLNPLCSARNTNYRLATMYVGA